MTAGRVILRILAGLAILLFLVVGIASWIVSSEGGARWGFERLGAMLPGELHVRAIDGSFRGPLEVHGVTYRTESIDLAIERLFLDWRLARLVDRRLDVDHLDADGVRLTLESDSTKIPDPADTLGVKLPDLNLPLDIVIHAGRIRDFALRAGGSDSTLVLDEIGLQSIAFGDTLAIGSLSVRSRIADLDLGGQAFPNGSYPIDLSTRWRVTAAGMTPLHGQGTIRGDLDSLLLEQDVVAPFEAHVSAALMRILHQPAADATIRFSQVHPERLNPEWPRMGAAGELRVNGWITAFQGAGSVNLDFDGERLLADFEVDRHEDQFMVEHLALTPPGLDGRILARGNFKIQDSELVFQLHGTWRELTAPRGNRLVIMSDGTIEASGTPDRYRTAVTSFVETEKIPRSRWEANGAGSTTGMVIHRFRGNALDGSVQGDGTLTWTPLFTWRAKATADSLNPEPFVAAWPGAIGFEVASDGERSKAGAFRGQVSLMELRGRLREDPIRGRAMMRFAGRESRIENLDVEWGTNRIAGGGLVGERLDLDVALEAHDLSVAIPRGRGSGTAMASVEGTSKQPLIHASWSAEAFGWDRYGVDTAEGTAEVDVSGNAISGFEASLHGIVAGGRTLGDAEISGQGRIGEHLIHGSLVGAEESWQFDLAGGYEARHWRGWVERLALESKHFGQWQNADRAALIAGPDSVSLSGFCLVSDPARLCASVALASGGPWNVEASLEQVPLALLKTFAPSKIEFSGSINGTLQAQGEPNAPLRGAADLQVGPGEIFYQGDRKREAMHLEPGTIHAESDASGSRVAVDLKIREAGTLNAALRIPAGTGADRPLDGKVTVRMDNLDFVRGLVPGLHRTSGSFTSDLVIRGTLAKPWWAGEARLAHGRAGVTLLGIELRNVTFEARSDSAGQLAVSGSASSGPGQVRFSGEAALGRNAVPHAALHVEGNRFEALHRPDAEILVSPNVNVTLDRDTLRVTGEVIVPSADIRSAGTTDDEPVVRTSEDVVVVGGTREEQGRPPLWVESSVRLTLENDVSIDARGLDAKVAGSILVMDRPGFPTTASGELRITQGKYTAYGQDLQIERGRLIFAGGPINNPGLDVRAMRHAADDVEAGFEVTGTLEEPQPLLVSDPPMAEREALAYVILGRSLEGGDASEQGIVDDAAADLGLRGGSLLASRIGSEFGLEEASLETTEGEMDQTTLMLGKFLSPELYIRYGVSILDPLSALQVRYFLSRKWTIEAESGDEVRAGIVYTGEE